MNKLLATLAAALALVSVGSFAASHSGAMKDKPDCTKPDKLDDKGKAECKKMEEAAKKPAPAASK